MNLTVILTLIISAALTCAMTGVLIPILKKQQMGQNIREEGPESHKSKAGTPSMGGIAIILGTICASVIGAFLSKDGAGRDLFVIIAAFAAFGALGFLDDYLKVIKKENEGLKVKPKFAGQLVISLLLAIYMTMLSEHQTNVMIPFYGQGIDFGVLYIPFIVFTMLAMVNAVNLTDGLDGLAAGTTGIVSVTLAIIAAVTVSVSSGIFLGAMAGACAGFLVFNKNPAKVFMGDTGSLALGGGLTVAAIVMKMELLLPIAGIIYVLEALSVCMQVGYFKATGGKRIFRMTPLHHHFELGGMHERKVVAMFWTITLIACLAALGSMWRLF